MNICRALVIIYPNRLLASLGFPKYNAQNLFTRKPGQVIELKVGQLNGAKPGKFVEESCVYIKTTCFKFQPIKSLIDNQLTTITEVADMMLCCVTGYIGNSSSVVCGKSC